MKWGQILVTHPERGAVLEADLDPIPDLQDNNRPVFVQGEGLGFEHGSEYTGQAECRATFAALHVAFAPMECYYHGAPDRPIPSHHKEEWKW